MMTPDRKPITTNRICPYLDRIVVLPKVFTSEECKQIINTALNDWKEEESRIDRYKTKEKKPGIENTDYRNTTLFVPPQPDEWLYNKILGAIMYFNNNEAGYQFHVQGLLEAPNLMRYQAADINKHGKPGKYDWHVDLGPEPIPSMRKISYSLLLNPGEYEGGELHIHIDAFLDKPLKGQDGIGSMIIFPSYLVHKISPMIKGTRYALVGWVHGNSFI